MRHFTNNTNVVGVASFPIMNYSYFIAKHLIKGHIGGKGLSGPVVKVAIAGIAIGIAVMIISMAVGLGFKREIRNKVVGFGSHIQVMSFDYNQSYETNPIENDSAINSQIGAVNGVNHIQPFITKPGLIKTSDEIHGIALKGVDKNYDWSFIQSALEEGNVINNANDTAECLDIVLSRTLANMLNLKIGDPVRMYFLQNGIRARRFTLCGIFNSHFPEFDEHMAFADMRQIGHLNGWDDNMVSGIEISIDDFSQIENITSDVAYITASVVGQDKTMLRTRNICELQPQIFGWLSLLDTNIAVILTLILAVAGLNMISGILILILENTNMIGILKAIGCPNKSIRQVFIFMAIYIIGFGLVIGNIIGLTVCFLQKWFGIISLNPDNYYIDTVPIYITIPIIIALNIGTMALTTLMLIGPSYIATRISPIKAIRFN